MAPAACSLPPSGSLPPLSTLPQLTEKQILSALQTLSALYCPLPASVAFQLSPENKNPSDGTATPLLDSGYTSGTEEDDQVQKGLAAVRADGYERAFAERWLTGFIARACELPGLSSEDGLDSALEQASFVLESFVAKTAEEEELDKDNGEFTRQFSFKLSLPDGEGQVSVGVCLNDGLAGTSSDDVDDVGLQSWGASIVFSDLICETPERFCLTRDAFGTSPQIVELGAGTGLVSLVLGAALPHLGISQPKIVATDYHPSVLANLRANIETNAAASVQSSLLDWSAPELSPPLDFPADMLIATDVVYAPEHAAWLRDCVTQLLGPEGVFWLVATVRQNGRFEGISDTVEAAFAETERPRGRDGRLLCILSSERLEKRDRVGRGDESGYKLFRIGWA